MASGSRLAPRKAPRQSRSTATVACILEAATRILNRDGLAGFNTNRVAEVAGVSVGSVYQYFPNKDALLVALTKRHIESATVGLADLLSGLTAESGFDVVLRRVVDFLVEQHELDDLHLLVMHRAPRTHEINVELDRARSQLVDLTSQLLMPRIDDPQRRALIARMVVATIDASVHDVILRQQRGTARRSAIDLTITTTLSIINSA